MGHGQNAETDARTPSPRGKHPTGRSLRQSLVFLVVTFALVPAIIGGSVLVVGGALLIRAEVCSHMQSLADSAAAELQRICEGYVDDLGGFALRPSLREAVVALAAGEQWPRDSNEPTQEYVSEQLDQLAVPSRKTGWTAVVVSLADGQALAWAGMASQREAQLLAAEYLSQLRHAPRQPQLSHPHADAVTGQPVIDAVAVIPSPDDSSTPAAAAIIWRIPLEDRVYPVIQEPHRARRTAEVVLVDNRGVTLHDLLHEPGTVFAKTIATKAVIRAIAGYHETVVQRDYRGTWTVAGTSRVPMTEWGLVAKVDLTEASVGLIRLTILWLVVTLLLAFMSSVYGRRAAERVVQPILELSAATRRVALGDLSAPLPSYGDDELGQMAANFNLMGTQVVNTEQQLREALRESREARDRLDAAISSSPVAIYACEREGGIQLWNLGAECMFGWRKEEVLGLRTPPIVPDDLQAEFTHSTAQVMRAGAAVTFLHTKRQHRDGTLLDVSGSVSPLYGPGGGITGYVGVMTDIRPRLRAEREYQEHKALDELVRVTHRLLAETTPEGLLLQTADGARELTGAEICTVGHGYEDGGFRLGATSQADHLPPGCTDPAFAARPEGLHRALMGSATSVRLTDEELRRHPAFGGRQEGHVPLRGFLGASRMGADGQPTGMIVVSHKTEGDFTPRDEALLVQLAAIAALALQHLEANHELTLRARELAVSNRELEAFSYSVSHDLRAPLRAIDGFSQAVLEDHASQLDAKGRRYLERVRGATQRLGELIDDLLQLSRVSRQPMSWEQVDLSAMAAAIVRQLREGQPGRDVEVTIPEGLVNRGHHALLHTLLLNLLGNAWKFTGKCEHAVIEFGQMNEAGQRIYFVRDDGAGFDMQYVDKLFAPFQRLHAQDEFPGHGVGLATVQRVINRHGGRVWAEGAEGTGATFYFTLGE